MSLELWWAEATGSLNKSFRGPISHDLCNRHLPLVSAQKELQLYPWGGGLSCATQWAALGVDSPWKTCHFSG